MTEADLLELLAQLQIQCQRFDHPAVFTVEEADHHLSGAPGLGTKNLFLKPEKGRQYLLLVVLENLIGNAWKFTARRELARIEVGAAGVPGGEIAVGIRDNGAGFDMAHAGKLFDAFQRLHSGTDFEGTGIGLAIVQRIIHRHGGRVWSEAESGGGAAFFFSVPDPAQG